MVQYMHKLTRFHMCGHNNLYLIRFSRYLTFKFWWRHNDVIKIIWNFFHMVQYMHKLTRFHMCGHNNLYLIWFSHYLNFKFWWRHSDVIKIIWKFFIWSNTCTIIICSISVVAIGSIYYGFLAYPSPNLIVLVLVVVVVPLH